MSNHGLRRMFSLLLAVMMVCTLLPTAAIAEEGTDKPPAPSDEFLQGLGNSPVRLRCTANSVGHGFQSGILPGSYQTGDVIKAGDSYTCTVTVSADPYISGYNNHSQSTATHESGGATEQSFTLTYNAESQTWEVPDGSLPIYFDVKCETSAPAPLTKEQIQAWNWTLLVQCANADNSHISTGIDSRSVSLCDGDYTIGALQKNEDGDYFCIITVQAEKYVSAFSKNIDIQLDHVLADGEESTKSFTATYRGTYWEKPYPYAVTFNVTCDIPRVAPPKPDNQTVVSKVGERVGIQCDADDHGYEFSTLIDGSYQVGDVAFDSEEDLYYCDVTVFPAAYLTKYSSTYGSHVLTDTESSSKTHRLYYNERFKEWRFNYIGESPFLFHVACKAAPAAPSDHEISALLEEKVAVRCIIPGAHGAILYSPDTPGTDFRVSTVTPDGDGFTCTVTVYGRPFCVDFNGSTAHSDEAVHSLLSGEAQKTVTLRHDGGEDDEWYVAEPSKLPVVFLVKCELSGKEPGNDVVASLDVSVKIHCTNSDAASHDRTYGLTLDGKNCFTVGAIYGSADTGYSCTVSVDGSAYLAYYKKNADLGEFHDLAAGESSSKSFTLNYNGSTGAWVVDGDASVVFNVVCTPCSYKVIHVYRTNGKEDGRTTHTVPNVYPGFSITIPDEVNLVTAYNGNTYHYTEADRLVLTVAAGQENAVTLYYDRTTYTVTYTDGVENEEVFADQITGDLTSGAATPAFTGGTPKREGYVFGGWNPAVSKTVTGDATYTAQWEEDRNGNGVADRDEEKYTVTYTDGAKGKAFADQVYDDLLSGTDTPEFIGTPRRTGYTFAGWSPKIDKTVTKSVTYTAVWKAVSTTGKDKVPKTGDGKVVRILGGVLLLSFCGASAAWAIDRRRKQG